MKRLLLALVLSTSAASLAQAEPTASELTTAREIFKHAMVLEEKGQWEAALTLFEKVAAVKLSPSVRFHIAFCHEHLGRLVEAYDGFTRAKAEAEGDPKPDNLTVRDQAKQHLADLDGRIPRLVIEVPEGVVTVSLDGKPINSAVLGTPMLVDPGEHVVKATAPGRPPFESKHKVAERDQPVTVTVVFESDAPKEAPSPKPSLAPWILGGIGVAALGLGVFAFAKSRSIYGEVDDACGGRALCPDDLKGRYDEGRAYNTWANVGLVTGAVALGGAAVWWFSGRPSSAPSVTVAATPWSLGLAATF